MPSGKFKRVSYLDIADSIHFLFYKSSRIKVRRIFFLYTGFLLPEKQSCNAVLLQVGEIISIGSQSYLSDMRYLQFFFHAAIKSITTSPPLDEMSAQVTNPPLQK